MSAGTAIMVGIVVFLIVGNIAVTIANRRMIKRRSRRRT